MRKLISFIKRTQPSQLLTGSLVGVVISVSAAYGFTNIKWTTVEPSPIGRTEAQSAVVDGKLYAFGGNVLRSDVYNPATNSWRRIADLPKRITHAGTAVVGKNIYLAGGYINKSNGGVTFAIQDVWRYNVDTNKWYSMPPLPVARGGGALELLGRKLHFFGGSDIKRADRKEHWALSLDNLKQGWTLAAPLPNPRNHLGDAVIGGKLYAIGGQVGQEHTGAQSSVYRWNPDTNTWTTAASLPRARSHTSGATFVMDGRIIVLGGAGADGKSVPDVTAYNPLSNSWTNLTSLPVARHSGVAGEIGGKIFYTTGNGFQKTTYKGVPFLSNP